MLIKTCNIIHVTLRGNTTQSCKLHNASNKFSEEVFQVPAVTNTHVTGVLRDDQAMKLEILTKYWRAPAADITV